MDNNAQPMQRAFRSNAIIDRQIDELIGLIKGVLADGMVHQGEVEFLLQWMEANQEARDQWPAKAIYPRLLTVLEDGIVDLDEEFEVMELLLATVGGNTATFHGEASDSTALPYTNPVPVITFEQKTFCFTGKFASGSRQWCEQVTMQVGGRHTNGVTKSLNYLVIGEIGSRDWIHSTHGRKIEKAIGYIDGGVGIVIVSEQHWYESISNGL